MVAFNYKTRNCHFSRTDKNCKHGGQCLFVHVDEPKDKALLQSRTIPGGSSATSGTALSSQ